jgi:hypothetical protein
MKPLWAMILVGSVVVSFSASASAEEPAATVNVSPSAPAAPAATLTLLDRHGHVNTMRRGFAHTGGANIDIAQPSPDTIVVTMTGVAVAGAHPCRLSAADCDGDLEQCFEAALSHPQDRKRLTLTLEARVIGLLRSHRCGGGIAEVSQARAEVTGGSGPVAGVAAPDHAVGDGENLSINDHDGPASVPLVPGKYTLHQAIHIGAVNPRCLLPCKAASAELAPDPALDPLWISYFEPFHGIRKKDFGFQVTLKVTAEDEPATDGKK